MMRKLIGAPALSMILMLLIIASAPARAQTSCNAMMQNSCTVNLTFSMNTARAIELDLSATNVALPTVGIGELNTGFVTSPGMNAVVKANAPWRLMISTAQATWQTTNGGSKPATDLSWATTSAGPFTNLSTTAATAAQGTASGGFTTTLYLRSAVGWQSDVPGQYALSLTYTLTAP
jgi:hypothetical protein